MPIRSFTGYLNADLFGTESPSGTFDTSATASIQIFISDNDLVVEGDSDAGSTNTETSQDPEADQFVYIKDDAGTVILDGNAFYLESTFTFTIGGTTYTGYHFEDEATGLDFTILPPDLPAGTATVTSLNFTPTPDEVPYENLGSGDEQLDETSFPSLSLAAADEIITGDGDDTISSGGGSDRIFSGDGADTIISGDGNDTIFSGDGDDDITAGAGNDTIRAGDGNDTIDSGTFGDVVFGGAGDDTITSGTGSDNVYGGEGADTIDSGLQADFVDGGDGDDIIDAGDGDDTVVGGDGDDTLNGEAGADTIYGGAGNDDITGGDGADTIYGDTSIGTTNFSEIADPSGDGTLIDNGEDISGGVTATGPLDVNFSFADDGNANGFTYAIGSQYLDGLRGGTRFIRSARRRCR